VRKTSKTNRKLNSIRESMTKREDYMSMRLPRSFANTVELLLGSQSEYQNNNAENANNANSADAKKPRR